MKDNGWWYVQDWHGLSGWVSSSFLKDIHDGLNSTESIKKKLGTSENIIARKYHQGSGFPCKLLLSF